MREIYNRRWFDFLVKGFLVLSIIVTFLPLLVKPIPTLITNASVLPKSLIAGLVLLFIFAISSALIFFWGFWTRKDWIRKLCLISGLLYCSNFYFFWFLGKTNFENPQHIGGAIGLIIKITIAIYIGTSPFFKKYLYKKGRKSALIFAVCCITAQMIIIFAGIFTIQIKASKIEPIPVVNISTPAEENLPENWRIEECDGWIVPVAKNAAPANKREESTFFPEKSGTNLVTVTWIYQAPPPYESAADFLGIETLEKDFLSRSTKSLKLAPCLFRINFCPLKRKNECIGFKKEKDFSLMATSWETNSRWSLLVNIEPNDGEKFEITISSKIPLTMDEKIALISQIRKL